MDKKRPPLLPCVIACLVLLFTAFLVYVTIPMPSLQENAGYSTVVYGKDGKILRVFLSSKEQYHFPPDADKDIPEKLETAVLTYEDSRFYQHPGVDIPAMFRALRQNIRAGKRISGGSTITMQLLRIQNPKPRTYPNKLREIIRAGKLETIWSKKQILRTYLEHAPYGGNVVGYRSAVFAYYGKKADSLTWAEAALLAVLPNNPATLSPGKNSAALKAKRDRLLERLAEKGCIDTETLMLSKAEPLPAGKKKMPFTAPHLCERAFYTFDKRGAVKTTLDTGIQEQAERIAKVHRERLQSQGIPNLAVLTAETETGKVRVYIGSQSYRDNNFNGKIDAVYEPHTVGSTIKPFLYAAAMDEGMLIPETKLKDVPVRYGTFSPQNIDRKFHGLVTAESALQRSLNVPAVNMLHKYGIPKFYQKLVDLGVSSLSMSPEEYGLPLILGSPEINLLEIAGMYRSLGSFGTYSPVHLFQGDNNSDVPARNKTSKAALHKDEKHKAAPFTGKTTRQVLSRGASWLTLEMLKGVKRPGTEYVWERFLSSKPIAWKTGTSYGQRDGWAVGVSPDWVVAVWVGSVAARENPGLTGYQHAAPLMLDVFNILPELSGKDWFQEPKNALRPVEVVPETGYRAPSRYTGAVTEKAPAKAKGLMLDPYYKVLPITIPDSEAERYIVCSQCWEGKDYKYEGFFIFPPDVAAVRAEHGYADKIPPHNPQCPAAGRGEGAGVSVVYPGEGLTLWIPEDEGKIVLKGYHGSKNQQIHWYIDSAYYGTTSGNKHAKAVQLKPGTHTLRLVDGMGRSDKVSFTVETANKSGAFK